MADGCYLPIGVVEIVDRGPHPLASASLDATIARIDDEMPEWTWSVTKSGPDAYLGHIERSERLNCGPYARFEATTAAHALLGAMRRVLAGDFDPHD